MAGCFGNNFFDREMERQLDKYLDELDTIHCKCGFFGYEQDFGETDNGNYICPECGNIIMNAE